MIPYIDQGFIQENTNFDDLISVLQEAFAQNAIITPLRHHHDYTKNNDGDGGTLLLMPSWEKDNYIGVKIVTVNPGNRSYSLPSIQGTYIFMDIHTGQPKAILDARELTSKRTAAASALASMYLSRKDASRLLMLGTGALSTNLIKAHAAVRNIREVFVWGRRFEKAQAIARQLSDRSFKVVAIEDYINYIGQVDIISCGTLSDTPILFGKDVVDGQHIDLVGSFKPDMREADDEVMGKSVIYVDSRAGALKESGDLVIPLQGGVIQATDIRADLFDICRKDKFIRNTDDEITLFKSVGHALEDLVAAKYYYNLFQKTRE